MLSNPYLTLKALRSKLNQPGHVSLREAFTAWEKHRVDFEVHFLSPYLWFTRAPLPSLFLFVFSIFRLYCSFFKRLQFVKQKKAKLTSLTENTRSRWLFSVIVHPLHLPYAVSFITLYLSHFPLLSGSESICIFIRFPMSNTVDKQGHFRIATHTVFLLLLMILQNISRK